MKPLPPSDFRSRRLMLDDDDFAISPGKYEGPIDLVDQSTWNSMVSLPDDVSIRTSDMFGSRMRQVWRLWDMWNRVVGALDDLGDYRASGIAAADASDELQAAAHCALVGYYRVAFSCLRNVLEQITVASQLDMSHGCDSMQDFDAWRVGDERINFGWAADRLPKNPRVAALESNLKAAVNDTLFAQRPKGFARRLFAGLSKYTHGAADFNDWYFRRSNGPVFVPEAFQKWSTIMFKTYLICLHELKLVYPKLHNLPWGPPPMDIGQLRSEVMSCIAPDDCENAFFQALLSF